MKIDRTEIILIIHILTYILVISPKVWLMFPLGSSSHLIDMSKPNHFDKGLNNNPYDGSKSVTIHILSWLPFIIWKAWLTFLLATCFRLVDVSKLYHFADKPTHRRSGYGEKSAVVHPLTTEGVPFWYPQNVHVFFPENVPVGITFPGKVFCCASSTRQNFYNPRQVRLARTREAI